MPRDLSDPYADIRELKSQQRRQQSATPMRSASVSGGRTRFIGLLSLIVEGSQLVTGLLRVVGTLILEGVTQIIGTLDVTGTTRLRGATTLENDLTLTSTGKIKAGNIVIDSLGTSLGRILSGQLYLRGTTGGVYVDSNLIATGNGIVQGTFSASGLASLSAGAVVTGTLTNSGAPTTSSPANLFMTAGGVHQRVTSAARYKIDPQELDLPDSLLDVPVEWWIDLGEAERLADVLDSPRPWTADQQRTYDDVSLRRVPGFIAEKVEAAGGEAFVNYTPDGEVDGVMYDRFVGARTSVLARRTEEDRDRIAALEAQVAHLVEMIEQRA